MKKNQKYFFDVTRAFRVVRLSLLPACFLISACTTTESGRKSFAIVPKSQMEALGVQAYQELSTAEKEINDAEMKAKVVKIASSIAEASGAKLNWEFKVFQSDQVNAFCLPGGKIGIYSAILPVARTNAGLAAIVGHEVAHATLLHGNERMSQDILIKFGMQASDLALGDSKLRTPIMAALGVGTQVGAVLPFGRFQETEADEVGLKYLAKAGYDPSEAAALWGRMAELNEKAQGKGGPSWLSTHPDSRDRQKNLSALAEKLKSEYAVTQPTQVIW